MQKDFSNMTTEQLEEILNRDFACFEAGTAPDFDMQTILQISQILAARRKEDLPDTDRMWTDFQNTYQPAQRTSSLYAENDEAEPAPIPIRKKRRYLPFAAAILLICGFAAGSFRYAASNAIFSRSVFSSVFSYQYPATLEKTEPEPPAASETEPSSKPNTSSSSDAPFSSSDAPSTSDAPASSSDAPATSDTPAAPEQPPFIGAPAQPDNPDRPTSDVFSTLQSTLNHYGIYIPLIPNWIPDGYVQSGTVKVSVSGDKTICTSTYASDSGRLIIRITIFPDGVNASSVESTDAQEWYEAGGISHALRDTGGETKALWSVSRCQCSISGPLTFDELKRMIDSIYT